MFCCSTRSPNTTPTGAVKIDIRFEGETFWLNQKKLAALFGVEVNTINYHLKAIFKSGELAENSTIRKIRIVQKEGKREVSRAVEFYNLDAIIAVGYRVNSYQATQFRIWATKTLKEYLVKGFVLDDERMKQGQQFGVDYFEELLERIQSIRVSERRFYQKITDLYAEASIDYDAQAPVTQLFYKTVQNKLHWAITGKTAAELIAQRANAENSNMGLTTWKNAPKGKIVKSDTQIAKNYLKKEELTSLERIVTMYLDYAENQAKRKIPRLYHYAQLLLAVQPNAVKYGVTGTPERFWYLWKESDLDAPVSDLLQSDKNEQPIEDRLPTEQDRILYALCRRDRLMELVYQYMLFDKPDKKAARYQQYFAVQESLKRVKVTDANGKRSGGFIWHTQGSGKSLTMVMLAKALALDKDIYNPKVVVVTDRISLDKQIHRTFNNCDKTAVKAKSGRQLMTLLKEGSAEVITTIINKFETAARRKTFVNNSTNVFVLIDEGHRSQYGDTQRKMRRILPNACYIGFTGTPLLKGQKTKIKFGKPIHEYTIDQAVKDKAVLPLLYEGRSAKITVDGVPLDRKFERLVHSRTDEEKAILKKEGSTIWRIMQSKQVVEEIAFDIEQHLGSYKKTPFKAQLAVPSQETALRYLACFDNQLDPSLKINAKVIISAADTRKGHEDVHTETKEKIQEFWAEIKEKYGNQEDYEEKVIEQFKEETNRDVELLIVVYKLLTGFDAPNNMVIYLAKPLADHNLLQAIARVNRLFESKDGKHDKEYGFIIDYVGVLGKLDRALENYTVLKDYDEDDIKGAVTSPIAVIEKLPTLHAAVEDIFAPVKNKTDKEEMELCLREKDIRDDFYVKLRAFAKALQVALSSELTSKLFAEERLDYFKKELRNYIKLRDAVRHRYFEKKSFKEYNTRIQALLDVHVAAEPVVAYTRQINIFDKKDFRKEIADLETSPASKADQIAYTLSKSIEENMEKNPILNKKFHELIQEKINDFVAGRLEEAAYLEEMFKIHDDYTSGVREELPSIIAHNEKATVLFDTFELHVKENKLDIPKEKLAEACIIFNHLIEKNIIRDWKRNDDVKKDIKNEIEDYLLLEFNPSIGNVLNYEIINESFLNDLVTLAVKNY